MAIYKVVSNTDSPHLVEYSGHTETDHHKIYLLEMYDSDAFIFEVNIPSDSYEITLPLQNGYTYNCTVDWGDGSPQTSITSYSDTHTHTYSTSGLKTIKIHNECGAFATNGTESIRYLITQVIYWGNSNNFKLLNFNDCKNLYSLPSGSITGCSGITTLAGFLYSGISYVSAIEEALFNQTPNVTDFSSAFSYSGVIGNVPRDLFKYNTKVKNFSYCFDHTNLGANGESLPSTLFDNCPDAEQFEGTFTFTKYTTSIPALFTYNTKAYNFNYTFDGTPFTGNIPVSLFANCTTPATHAGGYFSDDQWFTGTFQRTSVQGVPDHLFWYNTKATKFNNTFYNCLNLTNNNGLGYNVYNNNLFSQNTEARTFSLCFHVCQNVTGTLPDNMFQYNTKVTDFSYTFGHNKSMSGSIPSTLFANNTEVTTFAGTFYNGGYASDIFTGDIPSNLFQYNTKATNFYWTFRWQGALTLAPNELFRYVGTHASASSSFNFIETFTACWRLSVEQYIFSEANATAALNRFSGKNVDVSGLYSLGYTGGGITRYAQEFWDSGVYLGTFTHNTNTFIQSGCYYYPDIYTNYTSIPEISGATGWGTQEIYRLHNCSNGLETYQALAHLTGTLNVNDRITDRYGVNYYVMSAQRTSYGYSYATPLANTCTYTFTGQTGCP